MINIDAVKERLNRLVDITESGQMNRQAIAEFLTHGPSDLLDLLALTNHYEQALRDIIANPDASGEYAVTRAKAALTEA